MVADPTVVAIPFYFGSMEAERRYLSRRAERIGPSAADTESGSSSIPTCASQPGR